MKSLSILIAGSTLLACVAAQAQFRVCNTGSAHALTVAIAQRTFYGIQSTPIKASGWYHVSPHTCEILYVPVIEQGEFWVLGFSGKHVATVDPDPWEGSKTIASADTFCVSPTEGFTSTGRNYDSCPAGLTPAVFPIRVMLDDAHERIGDFTLNMDPASFAMQESPNGNPLNGPVYYAVLARNPANDNFLVTGPKLSMGDAEADAAHRCPQCQVELRVKNQCIAFSDGNVHWAYVAGPAGYSEGQTQQLALDKCRASGSTVCKIIRSSCATAEGYRKWQKAMLDKLLPGVSQFDNH
ncbi:hypothetical protein OKW40_002448 [Paraburkholderia sp. RAU6.4a]|uniref:DUF4189 domain-containing protein n=1 Tax=Paraburkholderia sp. RAU6.4a TaxID=2991067 RepID=UPI003D23CC77